MINFPLMRHAEWEWLKYSDMTAGANMYLLQASFLT